MADVNPSDKLHQEHQDNLLEAERHLQDTLDFIESVKSPTFGHVKLRIKKHIQQDLNWIAMQTGNISALSATGTTTDLLTADAPKFIMGKPVGGNRKPVTIEDTKPSASSTKQFGNKVNDLYNGFLGLSDKDVLAILSKPGGDALIRGVAKKAGLDNWETVDSSDIDVAFLADIREGIKENAKSSKLTASINKKVADTDDDNEEVEEEDETPAPKKAAAKKAAIPVKKVAPKKAAAKKSKDYLYE